MKKFLPIEVHEKARRMLIAITDYYAEAGGMSSVDNLLNTIRQKSIRIAQYPNSGTPEELLRDRKRFYRSLILNKRIKMVYFVEDETIHIAAFWDMRMHPDKLRRRIWHYSHTSNKDEIREKSEKRSKYALFSLFVWSVRNKFVILQRRMVWNDLRSHGVCALSALYAGHAGGKGQRPQSSFSWEKEEKQVLCLVTWNLVNFTNEHKMDHSAFSYAIA